MTPPFPSLARQLRASDDERSQPSGREADARETEKKREEPGVMKRGGNHVPRPEMESDKVSPTTAARAKALPVRTPGRGRHHVESDGRTVARTAPSPFSLLPMRPRSTPDERYIVLVDIIAFWIPSAPPLLCFLPLPWWKSCTGRAINYSHRRPERPCSRRTIFLVLLLWHALRPSASLSVRLGRGRGGG